MAPSTPARLATDSDDGANAVVKPLGLTHWPTPKALLATIYGATSVARGRPMVLDILVQGSAQRQRRQAVHQAAAGGPEVDLGDAQETTASGRFSW